MNDHRKMSEMLEELLGAAHVHAWMGANDPADIPATEIRYKTAIRAMRLRLGLEPQRDRT